MASIGHLEFAKFWILACWVLTVIGVNSLLRRTKFYQNRWFFTEIKRSNYFQNVGYPNWNIPFMSHDVRQHAIMLSATKFYTDLPRLICCRIMTKNDVPSYISVPSLFCTPFSFGILPHASWPSTRYDGAFEVPSERRTDAGGSPMILQHYKCIPKAMGFCYPKSKTIGVTLFDRKPPIFISPKLSTL